MRTAGQATRGALAGAGLFLLVLAGCGGDSGRSTGAGSTVIVGLRADLAGINPVTYTDQYTGEIINFALFTPLVQYDDSLRVKPHLAESWELTGDTGVVFRLRRDVNWHDGRRVTAEDVTFTFELAKDPAAGSLVGSLFLADVDRAEAVDSFTVRFHFARPHAQALEDFWWAPLPRHLLQNVTAAELKNSAFNRNPVGSGPFTFIEWQANQRIVIEPNPEFPQTLGGPAAARVVLRVIPEASTMLTELKTGGVHVDIPLLPEQVRDVKGDANLQLHSFQGRTVYYLGWNHKRAPFSSPRVRRALALGINRQEIIDALLFGEGTIATSTVPPGSPLYPSSVQAVPYDAQQAMQLLEQEGWRDSNNDGVREKNGQPLRFTMMSSDNTLNRAVVEMLQAQLRRIGVDVQPRVMEFQTMRAQHVARDFDAVFTSWVLDNFQVAAPLHALLHSSEASRAGSTNRSGVTIPELDRLIERLRVTPGNEEARALLGQITDVLQREQPLTFMYWQNELAAARREVEGVIMDQRGEFLSVPAWRVGRR